MGSVRGAFPSNRKILPNFIALRTLGDASPEVLFVSHRFVGQMWGNIEVSLGFSRSFAFRANPRIEHGAIPTWPGSNNIRFLEHISSTSDSAAPSLNARLRPATSAKRRRV